MVKTRPFPWKRLFAVLIALLLLVFFDQWTKGLAVRFLKPGGPVVLIDGVLELLYTENTGAAFGIMKGMHWFFYAVGILVSLAALFVILRMPARKRYLPLGLDLVFVMAGALGNLIDRMRYSYVVDFIYFKPIDFPVFNVADIYITCSCVVLALLFLFFYREEELKFL